MEFDHRQSRNDMGQRDDVLSVRSFCCCNGGERSYDVMTLPLRVIRKRVIRVNSVDYLTKEEGRNQRTIPVEESNDDYKMNRKICKHESIYKSQDTQNRIYHKLSRTDPTT
jgi:hypothetical protein